MAHQDYTLKDFLLDDSFRKWIVDADPAASLFWEQWLQKHPDKMQLAEEAREILRLVNFREDLPRETTQEELWQRIEKTIRQEEPLHKPSGVPGSKIVPPSLRIEAGRPLPSANQRKRKNWLKYAAILTGFLLAAAVSFYLYYTLPVKHSTDYGQVKTVVLPDNSVVKLNANSSLRYARNWKLSQPREVWLNGEAFFSVTHKSDERRFLVHTDDVTVQVVGTKFNVNSRHIDTKVVLNSGSVRLHLNAADASRAAGKKKGSPDKAPGPENTPDVIMKPGDLVSWSSQTRSLSTRKVDPERYSSWTKNILIFKDTPITEVARSLEDNFGLRITLEGEGILNETFTGTIPMDNVDVFFKTLSVSLNVQIIKKDGDIYIVK